MRIPRVLLAAGASGSGKTLITCGLLQVLVDRGLKTTSFKCGPDYIDPMFHSKVIGTKSANLDTFFTDRDTTRYLLCQNADKSDIAVMEGVMGYYDGVGGITTKASAYDLASQTDTPVILIVNVKGMSVSIAAYIEGFIKYRSDSNIKGVIFNQMSPMLYPRIKKLVESECGIRVLGYVPKVEDCVIESRHLGLVLPDEINGLKERLHRLAEILEKTLDVDGIINLANEASSINGRYKEPEFKTDYRVRIGIADDEAFCFFYKDNFRMLQNMGAELVHFSPLRDKNLPDNLDGLLLYGGYPELNGKALEDNESMRCDIKKALTNGMPCIAECGGFMYLHESMEGMDGKFYKMVGAISGKVVCTSSLKRFGYITLTQKNKIFNADNLGEIPAHEFHYFDSENCGNDFCAQKPESTRGWECINASDTLMAGFPHLYYYGNANVPEAFLRQCMKYHSNRECDLN